jgi:hypothetical protein
MEIAGTAAMLAGIALGAVIAFAVQWHAGAAPDIRYLSAAGPERQVAGLAPAAPPLARD